MAEILFSSAIFRAVIVGEVEMTDTAVKSPAGHGFDFLERLVGAEVVPEAEG
jgi:hypothetical protein